MIIRILGLVCFFQNEIHDPHVISISHLYLVMFGGTMVFPSGEFL